MNEPAWFAGVFINVASVFGGCYLISPWVALVALAVLVGTVLICVSDKAVR